MTAIAAFNGERLQLVDDVGFRMAVHRLALGAGEEVLVTVERLLAARTTEQNRGYWGYVVRPASEQTGHTVNEIHRVLKAELLPAERFELANPTTGAIVLARDLEATTRLLSRDQFEDYREQARALVAGEWGVRLPAGQLSV